MSAPQIFAQTQEQQDSVLAVDKAEEDNDKEDHSNPETDQDAEMKEPHDNQPNKLNKVHVNCQVKFFQVPFIIRKGSIESVPGASLC